MFEWNGVRETVQPFVKKEGCPPRAGEQAGSSREREAIIINKNKKIEL